MEESTLLWWKQLGIQIGKGAAIIGIPMLVGYGAGKLVHVSIPAETNPEVRTASKVLAGASAGAAAGAIVGSLIPGIGTGIGAGIGALVGAIGGWLA